MQALLAKVAAAPPVERGTAEPGVLEPGSIIDGTYRIERKLGAGGMGLVFLAQDLELDRKVALKVHRGPTKSRDVQRLGREAKVMARLNHRNVVGVYEIGSHGEMMFVAMEFLPRGTLRAWLTETPRTWRDIVEMFLDIGEGLTAAHELGIVHRDLKPDNVLVDDDGRAKVADFGLARLFGTERDRDDDDAGSEEAANESASAGSLERFTVTGAVVGTPAYMSPEQFGGFETSPASDQFSLGVMLYEALAGRRPFRASTTLELATAVVEGSFVRHPPGVHAPRKVFDVIARALDPDAKARHRSVAAMMSRLRDILGQRRRRIALGVVGFVVVGALGSGFSAATALAPSPCEDADEGLEFYADSRRESIAQVLGATDPALADDALAHLDAFADTWSSQRVSACTATEVDAERSDLEKGLKMACLDRMAARFDGLTGALAEPGSLGTISTADDVANLLPDLSTCEDVDALEDLHNRFASRSSRESTAQDAAYVDASRALAKGETLHLLARPESRSATERALEIATEHDLPLLRARAELLLADIALAHGEVDRAGEHRARASQLAVAAGGDDIAVSAMLMRAEQAIYASQLDVAEVHLGYAEDYLARLRQDGQRKGFARTLQVLRGEVALFRGDHHRAIELLREPVDSGELAPLMHEAALAYLGRAYDKAGDTEEAIALAQQHVKLIEQRAGRRDPQLVQAYMNLALSKAKVAQFDEALRDLRDAQTLLDEADSKDAAVRNRVLGNLGYVSRRAGRLEDAKRYQAASLEARLALYGSADHPALTYTYEELGVIARLEGDLEQSREHLQHVWDIRSKALGPEHADIAYTLTELARTLLAMGQPDTAAQRLATAIDIHRKADADPVEWAETELELVRALAQSDPARARDVREQARTRLEGTGKLGEPVLAELDAVEIGDG